MKVLLVDGDQIFSQTLRRLLIRDGFSVKAETTHPAGAEEGGVVVRLGRHGKRILNG